MADFRKWLYAFVAVALLAGLTVPASAQTLMSCSPNPNNPLIRAEDYTALAGDLFISCTGGVPTAIGALIPKVTITLFVSTPITSKLTDITQNPNFNEALLIVDEAGAVGSANKILNCGQATAPYGTTPFACDTLSPNGNGTGDYDGNAGHPNVFQARQVNNSGGQAIQFIGVPIDAPGTNGFISPVRTLRITNVRVNAVALNVTLSQGFSLVTVNATVAFNGTNFGGNQVLNVPIATVRPGLIVSSTPNIGINDLNAPAATFLQCNATAGFVANSVLLTEGFPSAFKVRNWAQIQTNGTAPTVSGGDWIWSGGSTWSATDLNQNVPNALYNTESGVEYPGSPCTALSNPTPNPPTGASSGVAPVGLAFSNSNGICQAGSASQGTRFAIQFSSIPVGSNPSVPLVIPLQTGNVGTPSNTGVMVLVCGNDTSGAGGTPNSCTNNGTVSGSWLIPASGLAVYEVLFDNPNALEFANVPVFVNPTINLNANPPVGGTPQVGVTATAQASFAPFYTANQTGFAAVGVAQPMNATLTSAGAPIPRFRQDFAPIPPTQLFSFSKCACDMLFPWVVADATYTTSIIVANTSLDPCGGTACGTGFSAKPQSGNVTFWFFGTTDITFDPSNGTGPTAANVIANQTTAATTANPTPHPVPPGSYVAFVISPSTAIAGSQTASNNLGPIKDAATGKVATNFAGYVIAQSEFQYCHGVANISASGLSNTYLGLILDKAGRGLSGVQLTRTVQSFADELNQ